MGRQLYLLRHAKAEPWNPLGNDFSRPLSEMGKRHAMAVAEWATLNLEMPDTVLCSPSRRTRETLAPLLAKWPRVLSTTDYVDSMYGAPPDMLLTLAADAFSYSQRLLMVGHNPGFEAVLCAALLADEAASVHRMATGTLAVIVFERGFKAASPNGRLLRLLQREDLSL
ncbi:MAG: histidine phosphatase family protein [Lysobacterales bacterium]|jgi:phosphohistidine phosphatase SixA